MTAAAPVTGSDDMSGPNTSILLNSSIIFFSEREARYITACIGGLLAGGQRAANVRQDVHDAYNVNYQLL